MVNKNNELVKETKFTGQNALKPKANMGIAHPSPSIIEFLSKANTS